MNKVNGKMDLGYYQALIKQLVIDRGFDKETVPELFMLLLEEAGEFAKAARKSTGMLLDKKSEIFKLEDEAADVFWLLIDLCNRLNIDLEKAFKNKELKNIKRVWEKSE